MTDTQWHSGDRHSGDPQMSPARTAQLRSSLVAEVMRKPRFLRRRVVVASSVGVVVLGLGIGSAAALVSWARPDEPNSGYCSASVTLDEDIWMKSGFGAAESADGTPVSFQAIESCGAMWRAGFVQAPGVTRPVAVPGDNPIPPLTACVVEGKLVVYPSTADVCRRLGVPAAKTDS